MSNAPRPNPFAAPQWSAEWSAYVQAELLWKYQDWKTRCDSPLPFGNYLTGQPLLPMYPSVPTEKPAGS
jgi:hypothetical protein